MAKQLTAKQIQKRDDKRIDVAYRATCSGIQVNMMDITKIFDHGRKLCEQGLDDLALATGVRAFVETIRQN